MNSYLTNQKVKLVKNKYHKFSKIKNKIAIFKQNNKIKVKLNRIINYKKVNN